MILKIIISILKNGLGKNFILWVKILLRDKESCVINGGTAINYFSIRKDASQSDPISAFLFVLALEIFFALIKSKPGIEGMTIFDYNYLYSTNADDTTLFLKKYYFYKAYGRHF